MDALAADRMLGEQIPTAYAFGGFDANQSANTAEEWESKGVTPILYEIQPDKDCSAHSTLHETLKAWADTYRDGLEGKKRIITKYATMNPHVTCAPCRACALGIIG
jgi:hypothetical protein